MSLDIANPIRLSELAGMIYQVMDEVFKQQAFRVVADIANHSYKPVGNHHYSIWSKGPGFVAPDFQDTNSLLSGRQQPDRRF